MYSFKFLLSTVLLLTLLFDPSSSLSTMIITILNSPLEDEYHTLTIEESLENLLETENRIFFMYATNIDKIEPGALCVLDDVYSLGIYLDPVLSTKNNETHQLLTADAFLNCDNVIWLTLEGGHVEDGALKNMNKLKTAEFSSISVDGPSVTADWFEGTENSMEMLTLTMSDFRLDENVFKNFKSLRRVELFNLTPESIPSNALFDPLEYVLQILRLDGESVPYDYSYYKKLSELKSITLLNGNAVSWNADRLSSLLVNIMRSSPNLQTITITSPKIMYLEKRFSDLIPRIHNNAKIKWNVDN